ncbi:hypothetical protein GLAREA_08748 [Glarea lozoyensis ATCC 20868]|uniref:Uncharacterized protein n=1 Tax=Glarea lozoyensis (strain ATCC 20868 / MF5171) TaxID=1116229 RepID=S3DFQ6_GLAL2|nr:uncharacterized protein GLAREA_08748 [Glarea lozoyensis ATCC 20868]EPE36585.1 hypothetical protein GLAREA_08748 [Glarea lozoyensis ATCC 20868]
MLRPGRLSRSREERSNKTRQNNKRRNKKSRRDDQPSFWEAVIVYTRGTTPYGNARLCTASREQSGRQSQTWAALDGYESELEESGTGVCLYLDALSRPGLHGNDDLGRGGQAEAAGEGEGLDGSGGQV